MASTIRVIDVIDEARDFNPSFDRHRHSDKALMRQITRTERRIVEKVTRINEMALAKELVFRNLSIAILRGLELPEHVLLLEVTYEQNGIVRPVFLTNYSERLTEGYRRFPSAYLMGNKLNLIDRTQLGEVNTGWESTDLIRVVLVPLPPYHTSLQEVIGLPDVAHDALVTNLAHFMALRAPLPETNVLFAQSQEAENALVENLSIRGETSSWQVRVTHYP